MSERAFLPCCIISITKHSNGLPKGSRIPEFDEYGIIIHDGGSAVSEIKFCPWCCHTLPESKRDAWFDALEDLGFYDPSEQDIPKEFNRDAWH
jgi:hypothetical protein